MRVRLVKYAGLKTKDFEGTNTCLKFKRLSNGLWGCVAEKKKTAQPTKLSPLRRKRS